MDDPGERRNAISSDSKAFSYSRILVPDRIPTAVSAIVQKVRAYAAGHKLSGEAWLKLTGQQGMAWLKLTGHDNKGESQSKLAGQRGKSK